MFFVAYRENDLYRTYVPSFLEGLPVVGKFVIPEGTKLEDCKDEFVAAVDEAVKNGATAFLTEETCHLYKYKAFTGRDRIRGEELYNFAISLDGIFASEVDRWLDGNNVNQNLMWFAEQMTKGRTLSKIVIVADSLQDHRFQGTGYPGDERSQWIMEILGQRFPEANFTIVSGLAMAMEYVDDENAMLVVDRHCGIKKVFGGGANYESLSHWHHKAMIYVLPFETTAAQLIDRGNFPYAFDPVQMRAVANKRKSELR